MLQGYLCLSRYVCNGENLDIYVYQVTSVVFDSVTPWTVACQAPLSMGFSRQEYQSGLPCPPPGDLPDPGIKPASLLSPDLAGGFFTTRATWKAPSIWAALPNSISIFSRFCACRIRYSGSLRGHMCPSARPWGTTEDQRVLRGQPGSCPAATAHETAGGEQSQHFTKTSKAA